MEEFIKIDNIPCENKIYDTVYYMYDTSINNIVTIYLCIEDDDDLDYLKYGYYINLSERLDRKNSLLNNFKLLNIPTLQMNHIDAKKHHYGAIGCYLSHIYCLHKAKENGYDHILICEDDIHFTNIIVLKNQLRKIIHDVKNWDVLMLASNIVRYEKIQNINYCVRVTRGMCATGYIVKSHYYDKLLQNFHEGIKQLFKHPKMTSRYAVDVYWNSLQKKDNWIIPIPLTVSQIPSYSNIENRIVNYDHLMLKTII